MALLTFSAGSLALKKAEVEDDGGFLASSLPRFFPSFWLWRGEDDGSVLSSAPPCCLSFSLPSALRLFLCLSPCVFLRPPVSSSSPLFFFFLPVLFPLAVVLLLFGSFDGAGGSGEDTR